ncbi:MAG: hypothetical protein Q9163_005085 [Psora crenata]
MKLTATGGKNSCHLEGSANNNAASCSLREKAIDTGHHHLADSPTNLRNSRVAFVSAGRPGGACLTHNPAQSAKHNEESAKYIASADKKNGHDISDKQAAIVTNKKNNTNMMSGYSSPDQEAACMSVTENSQQASAPLESEDSRTSRSSEATQPRKDQERELAAHNLFFLDVKGSQNLIPAISSPPQVRMSSSDEDSDVGEEQIIFTGRNACSTPSNIPHVTPKLDSPNCPTYARTEKIEKTSCHRRIKVLDDPLSTGVQPSVVNYTSSNSPMRGKGFTFSSRGSKRTSPKAAKVSRPQGASKQQRRAAEDVESLKDYISNIQVDEDHGNQGFIFMTTNRDLGSFYGWQNEVDISISDQAPVEGCEAWDSTDIQDFNDFSTSSEEFDAVHKVLARRERPSGPQYLVVGDGLAVDQARWLPSSVLTTSEDTATLVGTFNRNLGEENSLLRLDQSDDGPIEKALVDFGAHEALEGRQATMDLDGRRKARKTDQHVAWLSYKQEELGVSSSDNFRRHRERNDFSAKARSDRLNMRSSSGKNRWKGRRRDTEQFPCATALTKALEYDSYSDFDVMDQERPSLHGKSEGRRGLQHLELSDYEFEQALPAALGKDRSKKKARKQEREELRCEGLLGVKNGKNKPCMKKKYSDGFNMGQLKEEINRFLSSCAAELVLPPMDAKARKTVHEICHKLALKTKSSGSGSMRHPVIYKTSRTRGFDEKAFARVPRNFLPRSGNGKKKGAPIVRPRGNALTSVSYRDGEVVGAAAPELGEENRGRAMLEKMGWSTGTALGASNKGISVPVTQIVKTTRAGLG